MGRESSYHLFYKVRANLLDYFQKKQEFALSCSILQKLHQAVKNLKYYLFGGETMVKNRQDLNLQSLIYQRLSFVHQQRQVKKHFALPSLPNFELKQLA